MSAWLCGDKHPSLPAGAAGLARACFPGNGPQPERQAGTVTCVWSLRTKQKSSMNMCVTLRCPGPHNSLDDKAPRLNSRLPPTLARYRLPAAAHAKAPCRTSRAQLRSPTQKGAQSAAGPSDPSCSGATHRSVKSRLNCSRRDLCTRQGPGTSALPGTPSMPVAPSPPAPEACGSTCFPQCTGSPSLQTRRTGQCTVAHWGRHVRLTWIESVRFRSSEQTSIVMSRYSRRFERPPVCPCASLEGRSLV
jgi:hypothetical protein